MAELTAIGIEIEFACTFFKNKKDARFTKFADLGKRYLAEEPKHLDAFDKWNSGAGGVEVVMLVVPREADGKLKELRPYVARASALADAAAAVDDVASAVRALKPGPKFKPFVEEFQKLALDIGKANPGWGKECMARLAAYAAAENAMKKAGSVWRVRLDQLVKEAKEIVSAMTEKDSDTVKRRKGIQTQIIGAADDLRRALANAGV